MRTRAADSTSDPRGAYVGRLSANYTGRNQAAGQITNMVGTPRQIQLALKLIF